jgi:hypothetical protein
MSEYLPIAMRPVTLSKEDWGEIFYALYTKAHDIRAGEYGEEDEPGDHHNWPAWLERIMNAIGPDGAEAAARGVAACDRTEPARPELAGPRPGNCRS